MHKLNLPDNVIIVIGYNNHLEFDWASSVPYREIVRPGGGRPIIGSQLLSQAYKII